MFMHGGFFHILFNMYALWLFGGEVERSMGSKPFLRFYLVTGIGAGIITYLFNIEARMPTVGASGAIFGILVAYAMMFPRNIILAFFIIPMRAWQFVIIFGLFELIASVSSGGSGGGIAYNAHLGGMAIGFLYIYFGRTVKYYWNGFMGQSDSDRRRKRIHSVVDTEEYIRNEIDPILDKISKYGMNSLTRKEKKKLRDAKDRLR
jgi:membrane associated rhomboid family serine protease